MTTDTSLEIFKIYDVRKASHMMTDVPFWTKQFTLLANGTYEHIRAVQKVINNQTTYLDKMKEKGLQGKDEKKFYREMTTVHTIYTQQLEQLTADANEYMEIEKSLKTFEDKSDSAVIKLAQKYQVRHDKLEEQTKMVETQKKAYHKAEWGKEKTDIKLKMAYQPDVITDTKRKFQELEEKVQTCREKYTKHIDKWNVKLDGFKKIAEDLEAEYKAREEARTQVVLTALQNGVDQTMAGNYAKRGIGFSQIIEKRFVKEKLVNRERIKAPTFQEYMGETDKDEMYRSAKAEIEQVTDKTKAAQTHSDEENEDVAKVCEINKKLKRMSMATEYVVVKAFERQEMNQLNLKSGERVTQLLPPNGEGFAYGEVVRGLLCKKKKGFYPVSHVVQLEGSETGKKERKRSAKLQRETHQRSFNKGANDQKSEMDEVNKNAWASNDQNDTKGSVAKRYHGDARRKRREAKKESEVLVVELL